MKRVYWLNDTEILCTGYFIDSRGSRDHWWRFNYRTGRVLGDGALDVEKQNSLLNSQAELIEDGKHLFAIDGFHKGWNSLKGELIDTATLTSRKLGERQIERQPNGEFGLVPGGKYFHIGSHISDRETLKLVVARDFPRDELRTIEFSTDGARYAVAIAKTRASDEWRGVDEWSWYVKLVRRSCAYKKRSRVRRLPHSRHRPLRYDSLSPPMADAWQL